MNVVEVEDLSLRIGEKQILSDINFSLSGGETLVLMGKNASGKTMLLKTVFGLFKPQKGSSKIYGENIYRLRGKKLIALKQKVGYVFQKSGLFDSISVAENVTFALRRFTKLKEKELMEKATEALNRSGLKNVEDKFPSELSGGMQKRAGIARAIAMNPTLLFMDDPTAGLDPVLTDAIADLILEIRDSLQSSALVVTHDLKLARKLADRIGLIIGGKLHNIYETEEFFLTDEPHVKQFRDGLLEGPIPVIE